MWFYIILFAKNELFIIPILYPIYPILKWKNIN